MAAGIKLGVQAQEGAPSYPVSVRGEWRVIHSNLALTAETSTVLLNPGTYARLDNPAAGSTGITLTPTTAGYRDTTYRYGDIYDITGIDLLGANYLLALTQTAGVVTGGTDQTIELLACAIN